MLRKLLLTSAAALAAFAQTSSSIPDSAIFRLFFLRVVRIQTAADALKAEGREDTRTRNSLRNDAHLTEQEYGLVLSTAVGCTGDQAISDCIATLQAGIGEHRFQALHDYVMATEGPTVDPNYKLPPPPTSVHIEDYRPLSKAAEVLERHYGVPISYEDVSDFSPKGSLDVSFSEPLETATPAKVENMLKDLLAQHVKNGNPGQFGLLETSESLVIAPVARKNANGVLIPDSSPFDLRISFPEADRGIFEALDVFCDALSNALGKKVGIWTNIRQPTVRIGANNDVARVVLLRLISSLRLPFETPVFVPLPRASWNLASNVGGYALSVYQVFLERRDRIGRPQPFPILRIGPLDMNKPVLPLAAQSPR